MKLRDRLDPILSIAASLDIPVIVHQGDPPFGHPSQLAFLAEAHPQVKFIIAHMARQRVVMSDEAIYVASKNANVYIETGWGDLPRLKEGIGILSDERFVFGSDCPVLEIGSQLRVVDVLGWAPPIGLGLSDEKVESIMGNNMARMLGIE
jgi:predicted TIM-barrel fold metal-dependent hydrolase